MMHGNAWWGVKREREREKKNEGEGREERRKKVHVDVDRAKEDKRITTHTVFIN